MKIAFFTHSLHYRAGTERIVTTIANALVDYPDYSKIYLIQKENKGPPAFTPSPRVTLLSLSSTNEKATKLENSYLFCTLRLIHLLKKEKIDLLIINESGRAFYLILACKLANIKCIIWDPAYILSKKDTRGRKSIGRKISLWMTAKFADGIISLTRAEEAIWKAKITPHVQLTYIHNTIDPLGTPPYNPDCHNVVAVGRLTRQKGFDLLLKSWTEIIRKEPNTEWKLFIVGNDDKQISFSSSIKEEGKRLKNVTFLPSTPNIANVYAQTGIFVLPSRYECHPLTLIEAQSCGIPAVAFDCETGPSETVINNETGFLAPAENVRAFAEKLLTLMNNEELRIKFSQAATKNAMQFSKDKIIVQWNNFIHSVTHS